MRILIATDAWSPQVNGVVRTLNAVIGQLRARGHEIVALTPDGRPGLKLPFYTEIGLTKVGARTIGAEIDAARPDAIHIVTEGPIGWAARRACLRRGLPFTTGFHTRFAEYAAARLRLPGVARMGWAILRHFHAPSRGVMVPTPSMGRDLAGRGFRNIRTWTRGVNHTLFRPYDRDFLDLPRPILLYAGRLAVEKGIEDFLDLDVAGTKVLVGDGPERQGLAQRYPHAIFLGYRHDLDYARTLASADVLVFSSRTDTFGLVMFEAMACGTPVAAFDVTGPIDVVTEGVTGSLAPDLADAVRRALKLDRGLVQEGAATFTWERTADMFESWLQPITRLVPPPPAIRAGKEVHLR
jgi:glycosyltransferase involved in cell wall biosynthesis